MTQNSTQPEKSVSYEKERKKEQGKQRCVSSVSTLGIGESLRACKIRGEQRGLGC